MALPIPHDWDGVSWFQACVTWPSSCDWRALFLNSVTQYAKGRIWDEKTGIIRDVQEIGREISNRNFEIVECSLNPDAEKLVYLNWVLNCLGKNSVDVLPVNCDEVKNIFADCECDDELEDDCMAITNLKCENGKLYMEKCCQWVEVCDLAGYLGQTVPPVPVIEATDWHCTLAGGYAEGLYSEIAYIVSTLQSAGSGITWSAMVNLLYEKRPYLLFDTAALLLVVKYYWSNQATIYGEIITSPAATVALMRCAVYSLIKGYSLGDPPHVITSQMIAASAAWPFSAPYSSVTRQFVMTLTQSIGSGFITSVVSRFTDTGFDCTCGQSELSLKGDYWTDDQWFLSAGIAGSIQTSSADGIWPTCQWCKTPSDIWDDEGGYAYGIAFEITSSTSTVMPSHFNPLEVICAAAGSVGGVPTNFTVGRYVICHPTMYGYLSTDAAEYTLVEDTSLAFVRGGSIKYANDSTRRLSLRASVPYTQWSAYVTDFRFIFCGLDE